MSLCSKVTANPYYSADVPVTILKMILFELSNQFISMEKANSYDKKFSLMLEWLRLNACHPITLDDIVKEFGYNKSYLSAMFKRKMRKTVFQYINELRITSAKARLCNSNETVKQIAYMTGFLDEKYFMRVFKLHSHMTPSQYRNAYAGIVLNDE